MLRHKSFAYWLELDRKFEFIVNYYEPSELQAALLKPLIQNILHRNICVHTEANLNVVTLNSK